MGEFLGSSQTAAYMTGPRLGGSGTPTFLPSITIAEPACKPYDTYPAPTPLRRSLTTLPWRPSAYYGSSRLDPNVPNVGSMPEPRSDRNKLTELDSLKVRVSALLLRSRFPCLRCLADRTAGRGCGTTCRPSVCLSSVCLWSHSLTHSFTHYYCNTVR